MARPQSARFIRFVRVAVSGQELVAAAALVVMMLAVVIDVALRHVTGRPLKGSYDLVSFSLLIMVYFGTGGVVLRGSEIAIDLIDGIVAPPVLRALKGVALVLTVAIMGLALWAMIGPAMDAHRYHDRSLELGLPIWALWVCAFIGMFGITLATVGRLFVPDLGAEPPE